jgi:ATPase family associated with various cellular activities (AAA)/AAA+ lid domain
MDGIRDLRLLLASRHPLIVARMEDETRFMTFARRAAELCGYPVWTWSVTLGLARDGNASQVDTQEPKKALAFIRQLQAPGVYVFHDLRPHLDDPVVVRHLKEFALAERPGQTILITGPDATVPHELEGLALPWTLEPPARDEVEPLIRATVADLTQRGMAVALTDADVHEMVTACLGLTLPEIERLIVRQAVDDQKLDGADVEGIARAKAELLADDGVLQLVATSGDLDSVGGLKRWLALRARGFEPAAKDFGIDPPGGILIAGVPGCGKSLTAKCVARSWAMPLVLLDPGAIFAMYVGESEQRLRSALDTVEAMAPVVLWIDEIEKGFAGGSSDADAGTARRVIGTFLRWLQERPGGVFLIATCNDVDTLPPELLRRGRFDEVFFVDLPDPGERAAIIGLHLRQRHRDPASFDLAALAAASDGFTGAELEAAVVGALYRAFAEGREVGTGDLVDEIGRTTPLSRTRAEAVAALRAWSRGRATPASIVSPASAPVDPPRPGYA